MLGMELPVFGKMFWRFPTKGLAVSDNTTSDLNEPEEETPEVVAESEGPCMWLYWLLANAW